VPVIGTKVSAVFTLENAAKTAGIECKAFADVGFDWNTAAKVGLSHNILQFEECVGTGTLATTCSAGANAPVIEGDVTDKVATEKTVEVTLTTGFEVKCGATALGNVTGKVTGEQPVKSAVLKFKEAAGLTFAAEPATITGELETETQPGKQVFI
jgi:hypothetical protein